MPTALGTVASHRSVTATGPIPMTGLAGWWDAADIATITSSAGAVSQWNDKSGGNRHVVQATAAAKPTTGTATRNGKNVLVFDGGDVLTYAGATGVNSATVTVFAVVAETTMINSCGILVAYHPGQNDYAGAQTFSFETGGTAYRPLVTRNGASAQIPRTVAVPFSVYTAGLEGDGQIRIWEGGVAGTTVVSAGAFGTIDGGWIIGGRYFSGAIQAGNRLNGQIAEVIVYDRVLTAPERSQVESYLTTKWIAPPPIPTTGLSGWWDASELTGANGSRVTTWPDKSGNGRNMIAATIGPVLTTNGLNGKNVTTHESTVDNTLFASAANHAHLFVVAKYDGATFASYNGLLTDTASLAILIGQGASTSWYAAGTMDYHKDGVAYGDPRPAPMNQWAVMSVSNAAWGSFALAVGKDRTQINRWWKGGVAEVIAYNRVLSTIERQQVESYLAAKWLDTSGGLLPFGLAGWWDAADAATITASGGAVSQWNDKSGNARHVVQAGAAKPVTGTRTIGGKNALDFSADELAVTMTINQPITQFVVAQSDVAAPGNCQIVTPPTMYLTSSGWNMYAGANVSLGKAGDTLPHALSALFNGASSQMWIDGVLAGSGNPHTYGWSGPTGIGSAANPWDGLIAEVIFYNRVLSTVERQQVESYLATKWGTPMVPTTGLVHWLDATDASTFTFTTGAQFTQWRDLSGNGNHFVSSSNHADLVRSGDINGKTAVLNKNVASLYCKRDSTDILSLLDADKQSCMVFSVVKLTSQYGTQGLLASGTTRHQFTPAMGATTSFLDIVDYTGGRISGVLDLAVGTPYLVSFYRDGANMACRVNGVTKFSRANASGAAISLLSTYVVMYGTNFGHFGEHLHYARYNAADFAAVESYLKTKWGIP